MSKKRRPATSPDDQDRPAEKPSGTARQRGSSEKTGTFSTRRAGTPVRTAASTSAAAGADPWVGRVLDQRYEIQAVIGEGSMGTVYRCRHSVMGKQVAVKILHRELAQDPAAIGRFVTEAKAASAIGSEHIVGTLDFGTLPDGCTYFAMEYLDGRTLGERLDREPLLPFAEILRLSRQVVAGLDAAHQVGVVHRDLKPDNLFLVHRGSEPNFVKILDFGIAKIAAAESEMTRAGAVFGTPHYMSPEQATGKATDARSDIYSLGVILYELAAGHVPFRAETALGVLALHAGAPAPVLASDLPPGRVLPPGFEQLVQRCLSKAPEDRYQEMGEILFDLEALLQGQALSERQPSGPVSGTGAALAIKFAPGHEAADTLSAASIQQLRSRRRLRGVLGFASFVIVAVGIIVVAGGVKREPLVAEAVPDEPSVETPAPSVPPAEPARPTDTEIALAIERANAEIPSTPPVVAGTKVDLILYPLDAHVFVGKEDLGKMPLSVTVPRGKTLDIVVRRPDYRSRRIRLTQADSRVEVALLPTRDLVLRAEAAKAARAKKAAAKGGEVAPASDVTAPPSAASTPETDLAP